jgi:putative endonuclease
MGRAHDRGRLAEQLVADWLAYEGIEVVERNTRIGGVEVDILAREGAAWLVVEVKARGRTDFGGAGAAIDRVKRERLLRAARALLQHGCAVVRIDVVTVEPGESGLRMERVRNAVTE